MSLYNKRILVDEHFAHYPEVDVKEAIKGFLNDIKTICPNTKFNKEVDEKADKHFGKELCSEVEE